MIRIYDQRQSDLRTFYLQLFVLCKSALIINDSYFLATSDLMIDSSIEYSVQHTKDYHIQYIAK